jgi:CRISPR-associated protein (TIGR03984 family)
VIDGRLAVLTRRGVTLDVALAAAPMLGVAVALLSKPAEFVACRIDAGGRLLDPLDGPVSIEGVFEARVFSERGELRWLAGDDSGRAALLLDAPPDELPDRWEPAAAVPYRDRFTRRYLLWGRQVPSATPGWTRLDEARVGPRDIPAAGGPYLRLEAWEYVGERDGNACVLAERLVAIRPYQPGREDGDG